MHTILAIGELLVEFISHQRDCGLSRIARYSGPYPSGAPAIFVDQAALMGARAQIVGGLGDDGFGRSLKARLDRDGVGTGAITVSPHLTTGTAFVSYSETGERNFIFHLAGTAADAFDMSGDLPDPRDTILHVSAASLGNATMRPFIMACLRRVAKAGGRISCDPNARPELMRDVAARDALDEAMHCSTYLLPSTSDLAFLYPDLSEEAAIDRMLSFSAAVVALKRGSGGATVVSGSERHDFAGLSVNEIDPTGAGDCFGGTFVALLGQGAPLAEAGRLANAAGARAVTRRGPMEGNATRPEIEAFLAEYEQGIEP